MWPALLLPHCQSDDVCRYGRTPSGHQRFLCKSCRRAFQLSFIYEASKPGTQGNIVMVPVSVIPPKR
ncbi:hypothetical protein SYMBAF_05845 [Serratia symbiotica]|uniref:InsA N-terminal zinc ribbon domain-containing protein n=1 Tax=Serratia symbiotica TaxID=138074 RepID=A0A7D5SQ88_9GAMM|nr:hypothetical protein SYMBAF_05845 [Serratia symbiotica]